MTNEQMQEHIAALLRERESYEARGDQDGLATVNAELRRIVEKVTPPQGQAERRITTVGEVR